jgi:hypothetical protein
MVINSKKKEYVSEIRNIIKININLMKAEHKENDKLIKSNRTSRSMFLLLKRKQSTYFELEDKLKAMSIPLKYKNYHQNFIKAINLLSLATNTQIHGFDEENDRKGAKLLEESTEQFMLANNLLSSTFIELDRDFKSS